MFKALKYLFLVLLIVGGGRLLFELAVDEGVNTISKEATGHSVTQDGVLSNKQMYDLSVKDLKIFCRQFGKVWCDKNYAKGVADAKKLYLNNQ